MWNGCSNEKNDKDTILKIILLLALLPKKLKVLKFFFIFQTSISTISLAPQNNPLR